MKDQSALAYSVKATILLLLFFLNLSLTSCNSDSQETRESEDAMMQHGMTGEGGMMDGEMMQDSVMREDGMGQGMSMMGEGGMMQDGMMSEEMRKAMMSRGMGPEMMEDMRPIRQLLMQHEKIDRRVENLENGVRTRTVSDDPQIATAIRAHVRQMKDRMEEKKPIRQMDPVFRELFENAEKIDLQIKDIEGGVEVIETSEDPQVVLLIQQHAHRAVSEFVERGMQRAMQPTPLPEGYQE
ncbi:hypothetical protein DXT99_00745 [Pontibacter diazotrophicus]|uniref:Uncharacterized protein n=1 Tax=Pontibacter diazotrophicus TaxID=1400979 RepID=A0A3D8LIA2_9BACT|nr:hypothetical protein [Pontibacter diazotrophicus]RDV17078.1 hypothetical protein DXT99_00745 [Pontibacter diazotrophicus]